MTDFNKIKQILKNSVDKKLVVVDDDEAFVVVTLDEYQRLLESHNFVSKINTKTFNQDDSMAQEGKSEPPAELSNVTEDLTFPSIRDANSIAGKKTGIGQINQELNSFSDEGNVDAEVRYERLNNEFSEEPI